MRLIKSLITGVYSRQVPQHKHPPIVHNHYQLAGRHRISDPYPRHLEEEVGSHHHRADHFPLVPAQAHIAALVQVQAHTLVQVQAHTLVLVPVHIEALVLVPVHIEALVPVPALVLVQALVLEHVEVVLQHVLVLGVEGVSSAPLLSVQTQLTCLEHQN